MTSCPKCGAVLEVNLTLGTDYSGTENLGSSNLLGSLAGVIIDKVCRTS